MVEKIEVRTTSGGFIEVTRCEEGVVWVDIKRGDGTTGISGRLEGDGPTDLAAALDPKLMTRDAAKDLREKYNQACKSSVVNADLAYQKDQIIKALEASTSHGAYQKLNDELAKAKAEVASLQGRVVGRGAALDAANRALDLWQKAARDRLAQVAMWEKEALLRAGSHETLTAVAKVFACPTHDVVCKAESLVRRHAELCTTVKEGEGYVAGETWKQRDARHRETIHKLKQENHNLRGKVEKLILDNADRARPMSYVVREIEAPTEVAHVMSLTKQLEEARNAVKAMQKEVEELKMAGKILAEAMQDWRTKLCGETGFTYPNLVNLGDIVKEVRRLKEARQLSDPRVALLESERDGLKDTLGHWRKDLAEVLGLDSPKVWSFVTFIMKIRELKALASVSVQLRKDFEDKHRELAVANSEYNRMLELRRGDQETVKRCSDRVKLLETRKLNAIEVLRGARTGDT